MSDINIIVTLFKYKYIKLYGCRVATYKAMLITNRTVSTTLMYNCQMIAVDFDIQKVYQIMINEYLLGIDKCC